MKCGLEKKCCVRVLLGVGNEFMYYDLKPKREASCEIRNCVIS